MYKIYFSIFLVFFQTSVFSKEIISDNELRQLFIISDANNLKEHEYGGAVLFKEQFSEKTSCLIKHKHPDMFLFTDEEGGDIKRIVYDKLPSAKNAVKYNINEYSTLVENSAKILKNNCIDVNLAPFVEAYTDNRSFSNNKDIVISYASLFSSIMQKNGIKTISKHFPGTGENILCTPLKNLDHLNIKLKNNSEATQCKILNSQFFEDSVFIFYKVSTDGIMIGSNIYPEYSQFPAFLEPKFSNMIKKTLNYKGIIISDALWEIEASPKTIIMALKTVDWVMVGYHDSVEKALPLIKKSIENGELPIVDIKEKINKIKKFKNL